MKFIYFAFTVWLLILTCLARKQGYSDEDVENLEQFSYQVSLRTADDTHFCSGSILSKRHILTAAHCVYNPHSATSRNPAQIRVVAAQLNLKVTDKSIIEDVAKITVHPGYNNVTLQNDVAIIVLKRSLDLSNPFISTVKLRSTQRMAKCIVSGWGATNYKAQHENFVYAKVDLISNEECQKSYRDPNVKISNDVICADSKTEICNGDSGGPLLCHGVLTGVTSYCSNSRTPGIYTNLVPMRKWISKTIKSRNH